MTSDEFARRVEALRPTLYRVCRAQLAVAADREDAIQEAVLRAWCKLGALREPERFEAWLIRILINVCHNLQRQRGRVLPMEAPPEPPPRDDSRARALRDALEAEGVRCFGPRANAAIIVGRKMVSMHTLAISSV